MRSFTLFELVVVLAIIAIVGTMGTFLIDRYNEAVQKDEFCAIIATLNNGVTNYITKYREIPTASQLQTFMPNAKILVNPYTNTNIFNSYDQTLAQIGTWHIKLNGEIQTNPDCEVNN